jgi:indolepyruvate ferredoxin oxidoreductase, alpha subunit
MKKMGEMLLTTDPFQEIVMGNTALVRAMLEAGTEVVSSYPGSPTPEIGAAILSIEETQRPFYFEFSVNEKVATEVALGAALNGHLSTVFFKSVGLNVAADAFVQLPMMELIGGMVVILGDDPGANSSQNEQDNRHYARMVYAPVFEPGNPQEAYEMYLEAARISKEMQMVVILRLTTHVCHAKMKTSFGSYHPRSVSTSADFDPANGPYIPLTARALDMKRRALQRRTRMDERGENSAFHALLENGNRSRGIITIGLPYYSLLDVLESTDETERPQARVKRGRTTSGRLPDILKLGLSYPIPRKKIAEFCRTHATVLILEELDPILEQEIKAIAFEEGISVKILGKQTDEDYIGELHPAKIRRILHRVWPELLTTADADTAGEPAAESITVPARPAQMCPGCGHRSAFHAIKQVLAKDDITVADIGCHTLGALPPYNMGQALVCMGHSTGTGSGLARFNDSRRVLAFIGDSTLYHAGLPGIVNAVYNRHNLTLVIMANGTTAMTGHQEHPGTGKTVHGPTGKVPLRTLLEGLGVQHIAETDTYNQRKLGELVKAAMDRDEFSVVIARHPCMLKFMRERRKKGEGVRAQAQVDSDTCRQIHHCVSRFACPSFVLHPNGEVTVNSDLCIGDGSCLQTCPVEAISLEGVASHARSK